MQTDDSLTASLQSGLPVLGETTCCKTSNFAESPVLEDVTAFLADKPTAPAAPTPLSSLLSPSPNREPVRILVVGSAHGIDTIIHTLYAKGFAHISEWSRLMPHSFGKLMRILTRYVRSE